MPSKTEKQRRAMEAAAAGHGHLGIPKHVAEEFRAADRSKARKKKKHKNAGKSRSR